MGVRRDRSWANLVLSNGSRARICARFRANEAPVGRIYQTDVRQKTVRTTVSSFIPTDASVRCDQIARKRSHRVRKFGSVRVCGAARAKSEKQR